MSKKLLLLFLFSITILNGYTSETRSQVNKTTKTEQTLPQYDSVKEMLIAANDYYLKDGSLKFISEDNSNLHVQISSVIVEGDFEDIKKEIVKRDIVYVAFQAFAQTRIRKLRITAVPNDLKNRKKYYNNYKKTVTIDRAQAKSILKKYLNSQDFSILLENYGGYWVPNKNFNKLKFEKLNEVFAELKN